ncbi:hypothetical protein OROHE_005529 [Orobanche hederae]
MFTPLTSLQDSSLFFTAPLTTSLLPKPPHQRKPLNLHPHTSICQSLTSKKALEHGEHFETKKDKKNHIIYVKTRSGPSKQSLCGDDDTPSVPKRSSYFFGPKKMRRSFWDGGSIKNKILPTWQIPHNEQIIVFSDARASDLSDIPKLDDAKKAGSEKSQKCTLFLTEGDSAKSFAMIGVTTVENKENYGVFPLRDLEGKDGKDIFNCLRYGHVLFMADQDYDGTHMKGLLIYLIRKMWPSFLEVPTFLSQFRTPIIKATDSTFGVVVPFYTLDDFDNWKNDQLLSSWNVKYYKGLGSGTDLEAAKYFQVPTHG